MRIWVRAGHTLKLVSNWVLCKSKGDPFPLHKCLSTTNFSLGNFYPNFPLISFTLTHSFHTNLTLVLHLSIGVSASCHMETFARTYPHFEWKYKGWRRPYFLLQLKWEIVINMLAFSACLLHRWHYDFLAFIELWMCLSFSWSWTVNKNKTWRK